MMENELNHEALVVEDEPMTRMVAADAIAELGLKVHEADDADEALRVLGKNPRVSLLFTDVELRAIRMALCSLKMFTLRARTLNSS